MVAFGPYIVRGRQLREDVLNIMTRSFIGWMDALLGIGQLERKRSCELLSLVAFGVIGQLEVGGL